MKKLFLLIAFILIGCIGHAQTVTFVLFDYSNSGVSRAAYKAEGKLITGDIIDTKGLIYDVKIIKKCPCSEPDEYILEHGFYTLGIDDLTGGEWFLPANIFCTDKHNYVTPYTTGLPDGAWKSLKVKQGMKK
jgi:hypothetical protein